MAIPIIGAIFEIIAKLADKIPIQGRVERWRNEVDNLTKERNQILKGKADEKKTARIAAIDKRIAYLNQLQKNRDKG